MTTKEDRAEAKAEEKREAAQEVKEAIKQEKIDAFDALVKRIEVLEEKIAMFMASHHS